MSPTTAERGGGHPAHHTRDRTLWTLPGTALAWSSIALTVAVFPISWALMSHAIPLAILDTWVAPVSLWILLLAAAATGLVALIHERDTSLLLIVALVFSIPLALFASLMMIGEMLFPH